VGEALNLSKEESQSAFVTEQLKRCKRTRLNEVRMAVRAFDHGPAVAYLSEVIQY
jgi:hypothetical protein